jgi:HEAT repeat protein
MLELAIPILAGGLSYWAVVWGNRRQLRRWRDIAVSCRLTGMEVSSPRAWTLRLKGSAEPLAVRIENSHRSGRRSRRKLTRIVVTVPGPPGFRGVRIHRESVRPHGAREIELGAEAFDRTFFIEGPQRLVVALLDQETRDLLGELNNLCPMGIADGEIRAETEELFLHGVLALVLEAGRRLAQPLDVARRLAGNVREDPEAGFRLLSLRFLVHDFPGEPGTLEVLRAAARSDPSPRVRLQAAIDLGVEGRETLLELAEGIAEKMLTDPADSQAESLVEDQVSAQAVSILGTHLPLDRARAILDLSLRWRRLQTAKACVGSLGLGGEEADVETLARLLAREEGELAVAAAVALGTTGGAAAEPALISALRRKEKEVRMAAASALARMGSVAAVLPLKEASEHSAGDSEILRAFRQAIAEIQLRLPGASPGQLSLASTEAGRLSLARDEPGQLSLAADPAGQLSLRKPPKGDPV